MGDEPRKILPFYAVRLKHLFTPKAMLEVNCMACRRGRLRIDPVEIAFHRGPDTMLGDLAPHMRCQHCGRKGLVNLGVEWL